MTRNEVYNTKLNFKAERHFKENSHYPIAHCIQIMRLLQFGLFLETLDSVNERICRTFSHPASQQDPCDEPGLHGLLNLTARNLTEVAAVQLESCLSESWDQLTHHVNHHAFLEYRSGKLANANDRTKFDQPAPDMVREEGARLAHPVVTVNTRYLTNAQIKEANWQIQERAQVSGVGAITAVE